MKLLLIIKNYLREIFGGKTTQVKTDPVAPTPKPTKPESWESRVVVGSNQDKVLKVAKGELGVKEFIPGSNKIIEKYHAYSTAGNKTGTDDSVPWCASFVCYVLETAGFKSTNSKSARSYEKYGAATKSPDPGDIVVFWRGEKSSGKGHVAFFLEYDKDGDIVCLGGNQSNKVCVATYSKDQLIGFRRIV